MTPKPPPQSPRVLKRYTVRVVTVWQVQAVDEDDALTAAMDREGDHQWDDAEVEEIP